MKNEQNIWNRHLVSHFTSCSIIFPDPFQNKDAPLRRHILVHLQMALATKALNSSAAAEPSAIS